MAPGDPPRATIAHDFIWGYAGSERVLEAIAHMHPEAPVWAILGKRSVARRMGVADRFHTLLPDSDALLRRYRLLTPAYPAIVRARRLPAADVLVTSSFAFATGFRTTNDAPQLCYCHTPMRFAWSMREAYAAELPGGRVTDRLYPLLADPMRRVDRRRADGVERFVASSNWVAEQIERFYGRRARVIRPAVDTDVFRPADSPGHDDYFLFCGRLVEPYKRPTAVVEAFRRNGHPLVMAGDGPVRRELEARAPDNVRFTGELTDAELVPLMQRAAALIFPSRDDFGLLPVEVMACGRPVLALGAGGALETVRAGETGDFFTEPTPEAIADAVEAFDPGAYDPARCRARGEEFGLPRFREALGIEIAAAANRERL